jgi:histidine triad (HIT) family protein
MPSVFTPILSGASDPLVIWRDERCVAMHAMEPLRPGHAIVVPVDEIDHWIDLPPDLAAHLLFVSQVVARAVQDAFRPTKVGLMIAGIKVRHVHVHLMPIATVRDILDPGAQPVDGVAAAWLLRASLRRAGALHVVEG